MVRSVTIVLLIAIVCIATVSCWSDNKNQERDSTATDGSKQRNQGGQWDRDSSKGKNKWGGHDEHDRGRSHDGKYDRKNRQNQNQMNNNGNKRWEGNNKRYHKNQQGSEEQHRDGHHHDGGYQRGHSDKNSDNKWDRRNNQRGRNDDQNRPNDNQRDQQSNQRGRNDDQSRSDSNGGNKWQYGKNQGRDSNANQNGQKNPSGSKW